MNESRALHRREVMLTGARSLLVVLTILLPRTATAQNEAGPKVVPVEKAPFHVPAFRNEYVTMLNVNIPAGRTTLYHRHSIDYVYAVVETAKLKAQVFGEQVGDFDLPFGKVFFSGYAKKPVIHQILNVDDRPFHVVGFEIMYPEPGRFSPSSRAEVPAYKPVIDNERVRGWRLVIEPGDSIPAITEGAPGVRIVINGGDIVEDEPGHPDHDMNLKIGDFIWQEAGAIRAIRNTGATRVEFVEFELK
jgi:hypothetical protein